MGCPTTVKKTPNHAKHYTKCRNKQPLITNTHYISLIIYQTNPIDDQFYNKIKVIECQMQHHHDHIHDHTGCHFSNPISQISKTNVHILHKAFAVTRLILFKRCIFSGVAKRFLNWSTFVSSQKLPLLIQKKKMYFTLKFPY